MSDNPKILLVTPPLLQPNTAYPATAYLKGYLTRKGYRAEQYDLSIELLAAVFTPEFLGRIFAGYGGGNDPNLERIWRLRKNYISTVASVMRFLRGEDDTIANLICSADFLPQAGRFAQIEDLDAAFGSLGAVDCAKYLATLYLEDLTDFIRETAAPHFGLARYGEQVALAVDAFVVLRNELEKPLNIVEEKMLELLERKLAESAPDAVGFTVPFPGSLLAALRCGQYIREHRPNMKIVLGGGYPTTELRSLTDKKIFDYVDHIVLDDGEIPLERILSGEPPVRTYTRQGGAVVWSGDADGCISHQERGCPDFGGLPWSKYISLVETLNPMHRLWGDGKWIKMMAAHGCYWAKCAFCDTSLDYIRRYDAADAVTLVDWMEAAMKETGLTGFHFVDEALSPKLLKEAALEILRRGLKVSWWGNIRFESCYTGDLCRLLAASGCIAVSGGVEVASDRLLALMNKGVSLEQLTLALRNFYYAGILAHAYLMYGFPTQTLQETVDSLEVVRQLFRAELIGSAFWHRYAMTVHSPSGREPEKYGVRVKNPTPRLFANNEIAFTEERNYSLDRVGEGLRLAIYNYMRGEGLDRPAQKWFEGKVPATQVEETFVTDQLIKPDACRIYDDNARLVWIGPEPVRTEEGLLLYANSGEKAVRLEPAQADFLMQVIERAGALENVLRFAEVKELYGRYSEEPFSFFYHSKKWDRLREYGLLQI